MSRNSFGEVFRITTWGESHGKAIGVIIDGCPSGLPLQVEEIDHELELRSPGKTPWTSPRKEPDKVEILSGVFEGMTTGTPISLIIWNRDAQSSAYDSLREVLRPGHANYTYLSKYGVFDFRGGGRASGRETACRVAAGAIAKKILAHYNIKLVAYLSQVGNIAAPKTIINNLSIEQLRKHSRQSAIFCPDVPTEKAICQHIESIMQEGDSLGGIVEAIATNLPVGLGEPVYHKLDAMIANAMMSLPASKGFEIGEGFKAATMRGSAHNDSFIFEKGNIKTKTDHAGGVLGGITTGMPLNIRVAFKPPSSINQTQETVDLQGNKLQLELPAKSRHDPCIAIRAVPVVESMLALVLVDVLLMNRMTRL
ncbi:MAG: chorismate synthase [Parachlamydiales bacterium]|nr:chorismate synthase [Parachlamydiales bacterium]